MLLSEFKKFNNEISGSADVPFHRFDFFPICVRRVSAKSNYGANIAAMLDINLIMLIWPFGESAFYPFSRCDNTRYSL